MTQTKIDWKFVKRVSLGGITNEEYWGEYAGWSVKYIKKHKADDQFIIEHNDDISIFFTEDDLINFVNGLSKLPTTGGVGRAMEVLDAAWILAGGASGYVHNISLKDFVNSAVRNGICIDVSVKKGAEGHVR
jgi:hypothetical protein